MNQKQIDELDNTIYEKADKILRAYNGDENSQDYDQFLSFQTFCHRLLDSTTPEEKTKLLYSDAKDFRNTFSELLVKNHEQETLEKPYEMLAKEFLAIKDPENIINDLKTDVLELAQFQRNSKEMINDMKEREQLKKERRTEEVARGQQRQELEEQTQYQELGESLQNTSLSGLENNLSTRQISILHNSLVQKNQPELHKTLGKKTMETNDFYLIADLRNHLDGEQLGDFFDLVNEKNPTLYQNLSNMGAEHVHSEIEFMSLNNKMKQAMKERGIHSDMPDDFTPHQGDREKFLKDIHEHNGSPENGYTASIEEIDYQMPSELKENLGRENAPRPEPSFNNYNKKRPKI